MEHLAKELTKWLKQWEECSVCNHMVIECYWDNDNNIICKDCASEEPENE